LEREPREHTQTDKTNATRSCGSRLFARFAFSLERLPALGTRK
jgi:hypothetical protein